MVKWSEEWALNKLNVIHNEKHKAIPTEEFVELMMEVVVNENRALDNLTSLQNQKLIILHEGNVMLQWYYDTFYNNSITSWTDGKSHSILIAIKKLNPIDSF